MISFIYGDSYSHGILVPFVGREMCLILNGSHGRIAYKNLAWTTSTSVLIRSVTVRHCFTFILKLQYLLNSRRMYDIIGNFIELGLTPQQFSKNL